jgi:uncharacterized membrane protein
MRISVTSAATLCDRMDATALEFMVLLSFVALAAGVGIVSRGRGTNTLGWMLATLLLGPLAIFLWWLNERTLGEQR